MTDKVKHWGDDGIDRYPKCPFCSNVIKEGGPMQWGESRAVECKECNSKWTSGLQVSGLSAASHNIEPRYYTIDQRYTLKLKAAIEKAIEVAGNRVPEWGSRAEECFEILESALKEET